MVGVLFLSAFLKKKKSTKLFLFVYFRLVRKDLLGLNLYVFVTFPKESLFWLVDAVNPAICIREKASNWAKLVRVTNHGYGLVQLNLLHLIL